MKSACSRNDIHLVMQGAEGAFCLKMQKLSSDYMRANGWCKQCVLDQVFCKPYANSFS
jgi:hypothetical protein